MKLMILAAIQIMVLPTAFAADRAMLQVVVVDGFGFEVPRGVRVSLYEQSTSVAEVAGGSPLVLRDVPYGQYLLEITCSGFRSYSKMIKLSQPEQKARIGLALEKVGDPEPEGLTVAGKVLHCSRESQNWVRLVGLFTDEAAQAIVGPDCTFRIRDLAGGRYLGILLGGSVVKDIREIKVTIDSPPLVFDK